MINQKQIDFNVIGQAFEIVKKQWQPFVLASLIAIAAVAAVEMVCYVLFVGTILVGANKPGALFALFPLVAVFVFAMVFVSAFLQVGFTNMAMKAVQGGAVEVSDFLAALKTPVPFLIAALLISIASTAGLVACIVGVYVVHGLLMFTFPFMIDKKLSPVDAMKASFEALKPQWLMATCFWFVACLVASLGSIACGIGIVFTLPIAYVAMAVLYRDLCGTPAVQAAPVFVPSAETTAAEAELDSHSSIPDEPGV